MSYNFSIHDIELISGLLGTEPDSKDNSWVWQLTNKVTRQTLILSIYNNINLAGDTAGSLISVQTTYGYYELHDCEGIIPFEPDEILFVSSQTDYLHCLTVGKECNCSLYSNVSRKLLNSDFATLDPPVLLAAMQLSLTEGILSE
ncbi:MAG: hypothetical protein HW421_3997 [Ignavibacteria bacterium]|nr:hypothetical protein [Ignavibacteria bacterium]